MSKKSIEVDKLSIEDGRFILSELEQFLQGKSSSGSNASFLTYDQNTPSYKNDDPSTWTADIYRGKLVIEVDGVDDEALKTALIAFSNLPQISNIVKPNKFKLNWV